MTTTPHAPDRNRLFELLADRAMQGLSGDEHAELGDLLSQHPDIEEDAFDWVVAAIDVPSLVDVAETPPATVRDRVDRAAIAWLAKSRGLKIADDTTINAHARGSRTPHAAPQQRDLRTQTSGHAPHRLNDDERSRTTSRSFIRLAPWFIAAASIVGATLAWVGDGAAPADHVSPTVSLQDRYAALAAEPSTIVSSWQGLEEDDVRGAIVWNPKTQEGVMRLEGLDPNDPSELQYQLWIFDEHRRAFTSFDAVDGGVFNIERDEDVTYVHVTPKLHVFEPYQFAVTTEPPGGVVKHVDEGPYRIVAVAPVEG